jgi:O-antigen ligase
MAVTTRSLQSTLTLIQSTLPMMIFKKYKISIDQLIYAGIFLSPVFFLAIPRWTSTVVTLTALLALFRLISERQLHLDLFKNKRIQFICFIFAAYPVAVLITQLYWMEFSLRDFQEPGRMLLAIPIFMFVAFKKIEVSEMLKKSIPVMIFAGAISGLYLLPSSAWSGRQTVEHIDPLSFGYLMLFLALASILIALTTPRKTPWHFLCLLASLVGFYASIRSETRSGWIGLPFVAIFLLAQVHSLSLKRMLLFIALMTLALLTLYFSVSLVSERVGLVFKEIQQYAWQGPPELNDTSVGLRISFYRIWSVCFLEQPIFGWGLRNLFQHIDTPAIASFTTLFARRFAAGGLFHNELLTQLARHGVFGGAAFLLLFFTPLIIAIRARFKTPKLFSANLLIVFLMIELAASMTTEVVIVKPMIFFFGYVVACCLGEIAWKSHYFTPQDKIPTASI